MPDTNQKTPLRLMLIFCGIGLFVGFSVHAIVPPTPPLPPEIVQLRHSAYAAISRSEWIQAQELFKRLHEKAAETPVTAQLRDEIEGSLKMLSAILAAPASSAGQTAPVGTEVTVEPAEALPQELPKQVIVERFPIGKSIRSVAHLYVTGIGSNAEWAIKGTAHFSYLSQVSLETKVVESDVTSGRLVFEQTFGVTMQELAVSDQQLELAPPDSLPIRVLWPMVDNVMRREPHYDKFRRLIKVIDSVDPNLKKTLTTVNGWLKRGGIDLRPTDDFEIKVIMDKLAGTRFRIVYLSGVGVTSITPLSDERFDHGELIRLARSCNVVSDYFVFPLSDQKPGEEWVVQASDIGNLFSFYAPMAELDGSITLVRGADDATGEVARLKVQDGAVRTHSDAGGGSTEANLVVKEGTALFDQKHQYVRRANMKFSATRLFQSRDHLLFGTEQMRDLRIESRYEAELINAGQK